MNDADDTFVTLVVVLALILFVGGLKSVADSDNQQFVLDGVQWQCTASHKVGTETVCDNYSRTPK